MDTLKDYLYLLSDKELLEVIDLKENLDMIDNYLNYCFLKREDLNRQRLIFLTLQSEFVSQKSMYLHYYITNTEFDDPDYNQFLEKLRDRKQRFDFIDQGLDFIEENRYTDIDEDAGKRRFRNISKYQDLLDYNLLALLNKVAIPYEDSFEFGFRNIYNENTTFPDLYDDSKNILFEIISLGGIVVNAYSNTEGKTFHPENILKVNVRSIIHLFLHYSLIEEFKKYLIKFSITFAYGFKSKRSQEEKITYNERFYESTSTHEDKLEFGFSLNSGERIATFKESFRESIEFVNNRDLRKDIHRFVEIIVIDPVINRRNVEYEGLFKIVLDFFKYSDVNYLQEMTQKYATV